MHDPDRIPPADLPQQTAMLRMIQGFWLSRALSVVVKLGIADLLKEGPKSIDELAQATKTHAPSLYRVLRALAAEGVFSEDDKRPLQRDSPCRGAPDRRARIAARLRARTTGRRALWSLGRPDAQREDRRNRL